MERSEELSNANVAQFALSPRAIIRWVSLTRPHSGARRFRRAGQDAFQAPARSDVPALIELGRLLQITERILRDEETDEDLELIFTPGSLLGGTRAVDVKCVAQKTLNLYAR